MAKYDESEGVWRTVGGRRIFIKKGQDLADAMIQSGKFKNLRSDYRKAKEEMAKENAPQGAKTKELIEETKTKTFADEIKEKEDKERLEIAKDIAKEVYGKNMGDELLERKAKEILEPQEGEVLEKGDEPYTNAKGELERSTKYLKEWQKQLKGQEKTNSNDEYELYKKAKENPDSIDAMTENSTDWEALDKKYKDKYEKENNKDGEFVSQSTNPFYPDKQYSKEELKKMEENGVKPMDNTYSGSGWKGINADKNLSTKEQAKAITDEMKKQYPDVKISRKSDVYSGGSSIDFNIMSSDKDLYISDKDIDKFGSEQLFNTDITRGYGFERWANDNVNGYKENHTYSVDDVKKYAKETLNNIKNHEEQNVRGNEWYLSDYGKKVVSELNKQADSYTYDDSDAMTDYFNHGTYMNISIGKWNKPYQVNESKSSGNQITNSLQKKAYQKYMKEHPGSKMSFEDFKKQK